MLCIAPWGGVWVLVAGDICGFVKQGNFETAIPVSMLGVERRSMVQTRITVLVFSFLMLGGKDLNQGQCVYRGCERGLCSRERNGNHKRSSLKKGPWRNRCGAEDTERKNGQVVKEGQRDRTMGWGYMVCGTGQVAVWAGLQCCAAGRQAGPLACGV